MPILKDTVFALVLACAVVHGLGRGSTHSEDEECTLGNRKRGVCRLISECPSAATWKETGVQPVTCRFENVTPYVCCETEDDETEATVRRSRADQDNRDTESVHSEESESLEEHSSAEEDDATDKFFIPHYHPGQVNGWNRGQTPQRKHRGEYGSGNAIRGDSRRGNYQNGEQGWNAYHFQAEKDNYSPSKPTWTNSNNWGGSQYSEWGASDQSSRPYRPSSGNGNKWQDSEKRPFYEKRTTERPRTTTKRYDQGSVFWPNTGSDTDVTPGTNTRPDYLVPGSGGGRPGNSGRPGFGGRPGTNNRPDYSGTIDSRPESSSRPGTNTRPDYSGRPGSSSRPGTNNRPDYSSNINSRPGSSSRPDYSGSTDNRPGSSSRPGTNGRPDYSGNINSRPGSSGRPDYSGSTDNRPGSSSRPDYFGSTDNRPGSSVRPGTDSRPNYPTNGRPGSNRPQSSGWTSKRISEMKCEEYSKVVTNTVSVLPLLPSPVPVTLQVPECDNRHPLIVGGEKTTLGEFPHMAAVGFVNRKGEIGWYCGGALISDEYVLTAAHCTNTGLGKPVVVRLGEYNLNENDDGATPEDYRIHRVINHPGYKPPAKYNDISLLKLSRRVKITKNIRPACLHTEKRVSEPQLIATGWGSTSNHGGQSDVLLKVALSVFRNDVCNRSYEHVAKKETLPQGIIDSQICAGEQSGGKDACYGDSGGPLGMTTNANLCVHYVVGVTSFGKMCGLPNSPGVYTRVSSYVEWIESVVWPQD